MGTLARGAEVGPVGDATLAAPVDPGKIVCVGLNYAAHVTESDPTRTVPDEPVIFMKPQSALIADGEAITIANPSNQTDYEAELVVSSGAGRRKCRTTRSGSRAGLHRRQRRLRPGPPEEGRSVGPGQGLRHLLPARPVIETELDPTAGPGLRVQSRLNGEPRQSGVTTDMIFDVYDLVSRISHVMTLDPGDIILTGTPEGVGGLKSGDVIECEVTESACCATPSPDAVQPNSGVQSM